MEARALRHSLVLVVALALAPLTTIAACSSTSSEPAPAGSTQPTEPADASKKGGETADAGKDTGSPPDEHETCASETTQQACEQCCVQDHPNGYQVYLGAAIACACGGGGGADAGDAGKGGPCAADCKDTVCKSPPAQPDAKCQSCLQKALQGSCSGPVQSACQANAECVDLNQCAQGCAGK